MSSDIRPGILALLREEEKHVDLTKKGERRVKLERGQTWRIRFLPAKLGPRQTWYARISRHWVNMKPIVCPTQTHPDFGGNPDAFCPACEMAKILNDSPDEAVSKFGFKSRANDNWLTYVIVLDRNGMETDVNDLLLPWEFNLFINTWEELKGFFRGGYTKTNELSVLDYRKGNVFSVMKTAKGLRLDKLDQCAIYDDKDPNFEACLMRLEANIKQPKVVIPTLEQLDAFAQKMEDAAYKSEGADNRIRRTPAVTEDLMEETEDAGETSVPSPARRPALVPAAAPARRPVSAAAPAAAPARRPMPALVPAAAPARRPMSALPPALPPAPTRRPVPAAAPAPTTVRSVAPAPPAVSRPIAPRPRPQPVEEEQPPLLDGDAPPLPEDDSNPELMPEGAEGVEGIETVPDDQEVAEQQVQEEEQQEAPVRPAAPVRSAAPIASRGQRLPPMPEAVGPPDEGAEEEQLPEEATDQAPPAEVVDEQPMDSLPPPPPPVVRKGAVPGRLGDAVRARMAQIVRREA